jgi:hypothetical protein
MFEILPAAALLLLVQPAVQQPVSGNGIEDVAVVVTERALDSLTSGQSAKDDPVTNGAVVGAVIGAAAVLAVMAVAAKDGEGPGQNELALMMGAAAGAGAAVGAGVDAMLERSPSAGLTKRGALGGSRMRARLPKAR